MTSATPICRVLLRQPAAWALPFARDNAGKSMAARMAMMAITTSNSIRVKPWDAVVTGRRTGPAE